MRITSDELAVTAFLGIQPGSNQLFTAIGKLVATQPVSLRPGTPLMAGCHNLDVDREWRTTIIPADNSVWGHLETLIALYGDHPHPDPYQKLCALRTVAAAAPTGKLLP